MNYPFPNLTFCKEKTSHRTLDKHMSTAYFKNTVFIIFAQILLIGITGCNSQPEPVAEKSQEDLLLYVGTYTDGDSEGIYVYSMNPESGQLTLKHTVAGVDNPSYLTMHPNGKTLYAVNELMELNGNPGGGVSTFNVDQSTGNLTFESQVNSNGGAPCYVSVSNDKKWLYVANYMGGNISVHPIAASGVAQVAKSTHQHEGTGPSSRQEAAHAHSVMPMPQSDYVLSADLGADRIMVYKTDEANGLSKSSEIEIVAGAGPRHMAFHPKRNQLFVINELNATINAYDVDKATGGFTLTQSVPTLPENFDGDNTCADLHVSADGRFIYGTNRGHNSIVVYEINSETGQLTYVEHVSCGGDWPRNFTMSPDERFLLVANKKTNNIVVFNRDQSTGKLTPAGIEASVPSPVCLLFP